MPLQIPWHYPHMIDKGDCSYPMRSCAHYVVLDCDWNLGKELQGINCV